MFKVERQKKRIAIETGNALYVWDGRRGGQLTGLTVKDGDRRRTLMDEAHPAPNLTFRLPGGWRSVADYPAEFKIEHEEEGYIIFSTSARIDDLFTFEQQYEVFRESVVFCEFRLVLDEGKKALITEAQMAFDLSLDGVSNLRSNHVSLQPYLKQDVTTAHVLGTIAVAYERERKVLADHLLPLVGLDVGWGATRCFSNRIEFILEDNTSVGGQMLAPTATRSEELAGRWHHEWKLCRNNRRMLADRFFYRNKWGLFVGSARTEAGPKADPVRRNNALGARVCHVMYPYIYGTRNWPWCSVPVRQVFYQDVQVAKEDPPPATVDQAAALGANLLLIHQFWMTCGGSNGEPAASYTPQNPRWLKAFVKRAHEKGMRVLLYVRGIEQYLMYMDFFEKYLKRDWDGLYMDWAQPFAIGFIKSSARHSSAYNYFMFIRALRKRVGENGLLIGHTNIQTSASYACFDAAMTGEFSVLHAGLLASPIVGASYGGLGCCGVHLMGGNAPDRRMFSSRKAAAFAAGLGWANHPFAEPGKDFDEASAYARPLWDLLNSLSSDPVRVFNPAVEDCGFARWSNDALYPVAYKDKAGNILILVTNLSDKPVSGTVEIAPAKLGVGPGRTLKALEVENTHAAGVSGCTIQVKDMKPYWFCGALLPARRTAGK